MLLGRASGLLREMVLARVYGLTRAADLAMFAMTLPDLLTSLLIGGAVSAVLVPEYHRQASRDGEPAARRFLGQSFTMITGLGSMLAVILAGLAPLWVELMAPGFDGADHVAALQMARVALLAFPLSAATAVLSAVLQIHQRLTFATLGTLAFNLTAVLVIGLFASGHTGRTAAWAVVAGALARVVMQGIAAARDGGLHGAFSRILRFDRLPPGIGQRYVQALAAIGLLVLLPVTARAFASHQPGAAAAVSYALKLGELPAGICTAVISMIVLPRISRAIQSGDSHGARAMIRTSAQLILLGLVPVIIAFQWLADPVVGLIFRHGRLDHDAARLVADLARVSILGVPAAVLTSLAMAGFHARQNTSTPLRWGLAVFALLVPGMWLAEREWGIHGVVAATVVAAWAYTLILTVRGLSSDAMAVATPADEDSPPSARAA